MQYLYSRRFSFEWFLFVPFSLVWLSGPKMEQDFLHLLIVCNRSIIVLFSSHFVRELVHVFLFDYAMCFFFFKIYIFVFGLFVNKTIYIEYTDGLSCRTMRLDPLMTIDSVDIIVQLELSFIFGSGIMWTTVFILYFADCVMAQLLPVRPPFSSTHFWANAADDETWCAGSGTFIRRTTNCGNS